MEHSTDGLLDQQYLAGNLRFRYPGFWKLEEFASPEEQSATLLTEDTAFWMASLIRDVDSVEDVLQSALAAFEDEYEDLDIYDLSEDSLPGWYRQELDFQYQDLISSVVLQATLVPGGVLLVITQGHDRDLETHRELFDAVTATLHYESA